MLEGEDHLIDKVKELFRSHRVLEIREEAVQ
jgi:hypothetical protein